MARDPFRLDGAVAVVTGGSGVLGSALASGLVGAGASVALVARSADRLEAAAGAIGGFALVADVLDRDQLLAARERLLERWSRVDILVNAAGGNVADATVASGATVFDLPERALRDVLDLNLLGTLLPSQVFGAAMTAGGSIVNVSSMAADRAISRVVGYGAAKAGVENLTRWLAVELAPAIRVNAIAPGFFLAEQNRELLLGADGEPTERGRAIVERTPARRFGEPHELTSTLVWLGGPGASFVTGVVVPVDGGFSASSGV
jgi:NAD(P)-dependent dehydrogenase (short-subunit alcohol dehydrogenase family)